MPCWPLLAAAALAAVALSVSANSQSHCVMPEVPVPGGLPVPVGFVVDIGRPSVVRSPDHFDCPYCVPNRCVNDLLRCGPWRPGGPAAAATDDGLRVFPLVPIFARLSLYARSPLPPIPSSLPHTACAAPRARATAHPAARQARSSVAIARAHSPCVSTTTWTRSPSFTTTKSTRTASTARWTSASKRRPHPFD